MTLFEKVDVVFDVVCVLVENVESLIIVLSKATEKLVPECEQPSIGAGGRDGDTIVSANSFPKFSEKIKAAAMIAAAATPLLVTRLNIVDVKNIPQVGPSRQPMRLTAIDMIEPGRTETINVKLMATMPYKNTIILDISVALRSGNFGNITDDVISDGPQTTET